MATNLYHINGIVLFRQVDSKCMRRRAMANPLHHLGSAQASSPPGEKPLREGGDGTFLL